MLFGVTTKYDITSRNDGVTVHALHIIVFEDKNYHSAKTAAVMWSLVLSVCLSVSRITHERVNERRPNLVGLAWAKVDSLEVMVLILIRICILDHFSIFVTIAELGVIGHYSNSHWPIFLRNLAKWLAPTRQRIYSILGTIRSTSGSGSGLIRKFWLESLTTFGWHFGLGGVCALWVLSFCSLFIQSQQTISDVVLVWCMSSMDHNDAIFHISKI